MVSSVFYKREKNFLKSFVEKLVDTDMQQNVIIIGKYGYIYILIYVFITCSAITSSMSNYIPLLSVAPTFSNSQHILLVFFLPHTIYCHPCSCTSSQFEVFSVTIDSPRILNFFQSVYLQLCSCHINVFFNLLSAAHILIFVQFAYPVTACKLNFPLLVHLYILYQTILIFYIYIDFLYFFLMPTTS